jgi:hypothetical protein
MSVLRLRDDEVKAKQLLLQTRNSRTWNSSLPILGKG